MFEPGCFMTALGSGTWVSGFRGRTAIALTLIPRSRIPGSTVKAQNCRVSDFRV